MKDGGDRRALHQVAGIQKDAVVAVGALPADRRCEVGESPIVIVERRQARVQIVGMENGERPGSAASNEPSSSNSASRRRVRLGIYVYCTRVTSFATSGAWPPGQSIPGCWF